MTAYDVLLIGDGTRGYVAALRAAQRGLDLVTLVAPRRAGAGNEHDTGRCEQ